MRYQIINLYSNFQFITPCGVIETGNVLKHPIMKGGTQDETHLFI